MLGNLLRRTESIGGLNNPSTQLYQALMGLDGAPTYAGPSVNADTAMRISTVYSCVTLIAQTIAALPRKVYRRKADGGRVEMRVPGDSFLWGAPNPEMLAISFWECVIGHLLLNGNAYIYLVRNDLGKIVELWPLAPAKVEVARDATSGEKFFRIGGEVYDATEVLHVPGFGTDGLRGLSPIGQARQALGLTLAAEQFGANFFGNGATLGGILSTDQNLATGVADTMAAQWKKAHGGSKNSWKVAVLEGGLKYQSTGVPPAEAQYLELRKFQRSEICAIYRVPPHMIGDVERSTSWGTGIEQQAIGFVTYTLLPILRRFEEGATTLTQADRYFLFHLGGLLRGSTKERYDGYRVGREAGFLSVNDIRRLEDMEPVPNGDDYLQPLNFAPLGTVPQTGGTANDQAQQ